jgi:hypothetical protein
MQVGVTDTTYPDPDVQYQLNATTGAHEHDDNMGVVPDGNGSLPGIQIPCSGPPASEASMLQDVHHMIQVAPVPEDDPEERQIQLWLAVDDPNNVTDVYWDIVHPDGTPKIQVHGTRVPSANCDPTIGDSTMVGKMFEAAVHTGQVSAAAVDDVNKGMLARCLQDVKGIYYSSFELSKEQMCGEYAITATAVSLGGEDTLRNYIDVPCGFYLRIDFNEVDWGLVNRGVKNVVPGDILWDDPADNTPTVKNVGNSGMGLSLTFSRMVGMVSTKHIDWFDACFGKTPSTLQCIDPIDTTATGYATAVFDENPARVLCANEVGKLDLSIHPLVSIPQDTYTGTLTVIGRHVAELCEPWE